MFPWTACLSDVIIAIWLVCKEKQGMWLAAGTAADAATATDFAASLKKNSPYVLILSRRNVSVFMLSLSPFCTIQLWGSKRERERERGTCDFLRSCLPWSLLSWLIEGRIESGNPTSDFLLYFWLEYSFWMSKNVCARCKERKIEREKTSKDFILFQSLASSAFAASVTMNRATLNI